MNIEKNTLLAPQNIPPGHDLDILIAEHIFGYKHIPTYDRSGRRIWPDKMPWKPSVDISAAWEIVEKLKNEYFINIYNDEKWYCHIENEEKEVWIMEKAITAPHAICLAALSLVNECGRVV